MLPGFTIIDGILCLLLLGLGLYSVYFIKKKRQIDSPYFIPLFYAKLIGLILFLTVSIIYSNVGDTFKYYEGSKMLFRVFLRSPLVYFKVIFSDNTYIHELLLNLYPNNAFRGDFSFLSMIKVVSLFNTICFNSFWATSLLFCYLSFIGSWLMYLGFKKIHALTNFQSILILFFPSILFWASGIMKDSFCYFLLGILFYLMVDSFKTSVTDLKWRRVLLLISVYLLFLIKWYILFAFLASYFLILTILFFQKKLLKKQQLLFYSFCLLIGGGVGYEFYSESSLIDSIILRVKDFHNWHFLMSNSKYSFGEINYTVWGLISYFPQAVFTSLFRPFAWEVNNIFLVGTVIESIFLMVLLIITLFKLKLLGLKEATREPFILWSLFFILLLGYIVGLSSYSFGAMSRYRVPLLPFYLFFITTLFRIFKQRIKAD